MVVIRLRLSWAICRRWQLELLFLLRGPSSSRKLYQDLVRKRKHNEANYRNTSVVDRRWNLGVVRCDHSPLTRGALVKFLEEVKKSGRRELWVGILIMAVVLVSATFSTLQQHKLSDCNRRLVTNVEARSNYSRMLSALDDRRNTALLTMVNVTTLTDRDAARKIFLDMVVELQTVDRETKTLAAQRDKIRLPKLSNCL